MAAHGTQGIGAGGGRRRGERGMIAVLAAASIFVLLLLASGLFTIGMGALHKMEEQHATDAVCAANAMVALSSPSGSFNVGSGMNTALAGLFPNGAPPGPSPISAVDTTLNYNPSVTQAVHADNQAGMVDTSLLLRGDGKLSTASHASCTAAVNQWELGPNDFEVLPGRIILVLDDSASMKLPAPGLGAGDEAINWMKQSVKMLTSPNPAVNPLYGRVNWGLVPVAAQVITASTIPPLPYNQALMGGSTVETVAIASHNNIIFQTANALQPVNNNGGSNLTLGIQTAINMLNTPPQSNQERMLSGGKMVLMITDGEPSFGCIGLPPANYNTCVQSQQNSILALVNSTPNITFASIPVLTNSTFSALLKQSFLQQFNSTNGTPSLNTPQPVANQQQLLAMLQQINPANHCVSRQPLQPPGGSWMAQVQDPGGADPIFAYWNSATDTSPQTERPLRRLFNQDLSYFDEYPPKGSNVFPLNVPHGPDNATDYFYYDVATRLVELSANTCLTEYRQNQNRGTLRVRWAAPHLLSPLLASGGH